MVGWLLSTLLMSFCRLSPTKEAAGATAGKRNELAADLIPEVVSELLVEGIQGMRCGNAAGQQSCCYAVEELRDQFNSHDLEN